MRNIPPSIDHGPARYDDKYERAQKQDEQVAQIVLTLDYVLSQMAWGFVRENQHDAAIEARHYRDRLRDVMRGGDANG
jgi:nanoRNase/pAp phosphatase (c-di-AMP/oligoRNAs hydrolase)